MGLNGYLSNRVAQIGDSKDEELMQVKAQLVEVMRKAEDKLERAHDDYSGMTKEQFKKMQEFIAGRSSNNPPSKM
ncbi:hypothetical protein AgCh_018288 [Apium graveolens]